MKTGEFQVLGIRKATTKQGRQGVVLFLTTPFEEWEINGADSCVGFKTCSEFTYDSSIIPNDLKVNDLVTLDFRKGYENKAVLSGVHIIKGK